MEPVQKNKLVGAAGNGMNQKAESGGAGNPPRVSAAKNPSKYSGKDSDRLGQLSSSLKKVYQTTVNEAVPDSMMDLLKKLG